jgi:hypothetical protein
VQGKEKLSTYHYQLSSFISKPVELKRVERPSILQLLISMEEIQIWKFFQHEVGGGSPCHLTWK